MVVVVGTLGAAAATLAWTQTKGVDIKVPGESASEVTKCAPGVMTIKHDTDHFDTTDPEERTMGDFDMDSWSASCSEAFDAKQRGLQKEHGIGTQKYADWHYDRRIAQLTFLDDRGRAIILADVVEIGTYVPSLQLWAWAWGDESTELTLGFESRRLCKTLHDLTGHEMFTLPSFDLPANRTSHLLAMAVEALHAKGAYRPEDKPDSQVFLVIKAVRPYSTSVFP